MYPWNQNLWAHNYAMAYEEQVDFDVDFDFRYAAAQQAGAMNYSYWQGCQFPVPYGPYPSKGSFGHSPDPAERTCSPCTFLLGALGCRNGFDCSFCHFDHSQRRPVRPCKGARQRLQKFISKTEANIQEDPGFMEGPDFQLPRLLQENQSLRDKVMRQLLAFAEEQRRSQQSDSAPSTPTLSATIAEFGTPWAAAGPTVAHSDKTKAATLSSMSVDALANKSKLLQLCVISL
mmetsp:Transcript_29035/g.67565  ORF Transcript_29035/g.67565 Transcript_29035/m.67565 type:complete len:232 (-) Transcript_29035:93-788(-)